MELADLLAREGYAAKDLPTLMAWARARADALLEGVDLDSPVGLLLERTSEHVSEDLSMSALEENVPDLRRAVTAATSSSPQPAAADTEVPLIDDDPDAGLGGFTRFGALMRTHRPYPYRDQEERAPQDVEPEPEPAPEPAPTPDLSATLPLAALGFSAEESGGLVLGIPDEESGLIALFDLEGAPSPVDPAESPSPATTGLPDDDELRGPAHLLDDDDDELRGPGHLLDDDDDEPRVTHSVGPVGMLDDDDEPRVAHSPGADPLHLVDDDDEPRVARSAGLAGMLDDDDEPRVAHSPGADPSHLVDDDDEPRVAHSPGADPSHLVDDDDDEFPPVSGGRSAGPAGLLDDDDDLPLGMSVPTTVASPLADETIADPRRTRDTPSSVPAVDSEHDAGAPVLRHRGPKKRVVELGAPVGKPRIGNSNAIVVPPRNAKTSRRPPPPPPRRPVPVVEEEIQELSRVELIDDLPAYLRDDDEDV